MEHGTEHAFDFVDTCLHLAAVPDKPLSPSAIDLFHTVAQVRIRAGIDFGFNTGNVDLILRGDLDRLNFTELPTGISWGEARTDRLPIMAIDEAGNEVSERYFMLANGKLILKRKVVPSMLTLDERIIRQDCLGYLMERFHTRVG